MRSGKFVPRHLKSLLIESLESSPVTLLHGPRQCGKTTLCKEIGEDLGYTYFTFDSDEVRISAQNDPNLFLRNCSERTILDEIQRVPQLSRNLKIADDRNRKAGMFLLTGSSNVLMMPDLADALVGRMETLRLHPFSQQEIEQSQSKSFIERLFSGDFPTCSAEALSTNLAQRIVLGGYPQVLNLSSDRKRSNWLKNYVENIISKDILDLSKIRSIEVLPKLLQSVAHLTGQLLNISDIGSSLQMNRNTTQDYLTLLEYQFLIERLPAWYTNRLNRLIKTPKIHFGDTGIACALLGLNANDLNEQRTLLGHLLETFVFQELKKQASFSDQQYSFFHFRDRDQVEVDLVIERGAFEIAGIEVKAGASIVNSDFKGLRKLKSTCPDQFTYGAVLYDGEVCASFGNGMYMVPIRMLWESNPKPLSY
ncbi:MAG: ATP-binding protein [Bacteroidetes bacterium]|nr:ATP-binding protein [Bacteroidota bacterium]MCY4224864.1 ATP-binding protein [Bacteroidota bacterium]